MSVPKVLADGSLNEIRREDWEQIASMRIMGVGVMKIAELIGCDYHGLIPLFAQEEYLEIEGSLRAEEASRHKAFNDAWDGAESRAIDIVNMTLETNHDPEYALKVARIANMATRRGGSALGVIHAQKGMRAGFVLPSGFLQTLMAPGSETVVNNVQINGNVQVNNGEKVDRSGVPKGREPGGKLVSAAKTFLKRPTQDIDILSPAEVDRILTEVNDASGTDEALAVMGIEIPE